MGTRNDILCECGRFRHWPCKVCGGATTDHHGHDSPVGETQERPIYLDPTSIDRPFVSEPPILTERSEHTRIEDEPVMAMLPMRESESLIPDQSVLDSYIPRKVDGLTDLVVLQKAWQYNQTDARRKMNILLIGDAGTGKNHLAEALGAWAKVPVWSISLNGGSTVEDIVGQPLFINGTTVWVDGVLTYAMRHGGIVVLDEVNACPNEITFVLHQILDNRRTLTLVQKGREVVRAHKDFFAIGTMNPDYRGTKPLNEAFKDRFHLPIEIDYDEKVEKKLIPGEDKVLELASKLRKMFRAGELDTPCSTRMLLDYVENKKLLGVSMGKAAFLARYSRSDQSAVGEAWDISMGAAATASLEFSNE